MLFQLYLVVYFWFSYSETYNSITKCIINLLIVNSYECLFSKWFLLVTYLALTTETETTDWRSETLAWKEMRPEYLWSFRWHTWRQHKRRNAAVHRRVDVLISVDIYLQVPEKSSLPPKPSALPSSSCLGGASLHPAQASSAALRPHSPSMEPKGKGEQGPTLDELKTQLRELRATVELMKSQHK